MKGTKNNVKNLIDLGGLIGRKVNISCSLDEAIDELLMESAIKSGRSKKREAELRLEDHLRRFSLVPTEEQYIEKKSD
ncbi:TraY domain-containing protein [Escherichia coli]|uniref:TraY domain-containing protein n=1 Tax=Escherichia coli TaxID=562 RepID=UPI00191887E0|nr:TraY domain-containing protein [Escherichia coli]EEW7663089.1 TraY domain-containing protein [Escherichia coli]EHQ3208336.1 TraY domain-containing protein [Salmonella enterica]CAD5570394.1 conjugal transfer protein TraY [Escherichia coli]